MGVGAWDAAAVLIKAVLFVATFGAAGGVFFLAYSPPLSPASDSRISRLIAVLVIIGILVSGLRILVLAGSMGGEIDGMIDRSLTGMIVAGREGEATGVRVFGLLLAAVALHRDRRYWTIASFGALIAATSFAWVGHAQAVVPKSPAVALIAVHLIGVAFWLGALSPLLVVARDPDMTRIAVVTARFGQAALIVVAVLVVAGLCLLWILLGTTSQLWLSAYGRWVMLKLGLVAVLLSLAALNKWRLTARLQIHDPRAVQSLRRSIRAEMAVCALILLVTAGFTTLLGPPTIE